MCKWKCLLSGDMQIIAHIIFRVLGNSLEKLGNVIQKQKEKKKVSVNIVPKMLRKVDRVFQNGGLDMGSYSFLQRYRNL